MRLEGTIPLTALLLGVAAVGIYFGYAMYNNQGTSANYVSLSSFSLDSNGLQGNIKVASHYRISSMELYLNGAHIGSYNYTYMRSMMIGMMGNYPYMYTMMLSIPRASTSAFAGFPVMSNRAYNVTMIATFQDGSTCSGYTMINT